MNRIRCTLPRDAFTLAVDVQLPAAGITALLGPSGCGKTTLLRCVAGLERPRDALVEFAGEAWQDDARGLFLAPWQRAVGYVFQEASLFDHLDVNGNLRFAQQRARSGPEVPLQALIELLGIGGLLARRPAQLSGGERQRVAIARALAGRPRVLLLDEPLAALDQSRRREILPWLEKQRDELRIPMLYVTHAADEAARLADHVLAMEAGRVVASGPLADVITRLDLPGARADDAGAVLECTVAERDPRWHLMRVDFAGGSLWLRDAEQAMGRRVRVHVLARDVSLATERPRHTSIQNLLPCTVGEVAAGGHASQALVRLDCAGHPLLARITARAADALQLQPGTPVWAQVKSAALVE
jgi:molybdate transport system ATP-binding protein